MNELAFLDATAQAQLVRRKQVQAAELVEHAIERVEQLNPTINAVVTTTYDLAREIAAGELPSGPFAGVPFMLKDIYGFYAGVRQTHGSESWGDYVPNFDSELVARYKRAGLILVGKTNTPEYGLSAATEPRRYGATRNPWDTNRSPGGSSGGSAAAVAAGIVPMAHANDGAGSIRIPASCCGLFGLKPTRSRNPLRPQFSDLMAPVVSEHAVTRSVRDSATLLDATSGPAVGEPYQAPTPRRPFIEEVGADPGSLRIAYSTEPFSGAPVHEDCLAAVEDAATLCAELGHQVTEATPRVNGDSVSEALSQLWFLFGAMSVEGVKDITGSPADPKRVEPWSWALYEVGKDMRATDYVRSLQALQQALYVYGEFFSEYDVLLTPTLSTPPFPLGTFEFSTNDDPREAFDRLWWTIFPFTPLINVTGQPAMSVPTHWNAEGLPIGTHFVGRFGDEATLFRLAAQLEEARPWAGRRPPVQTSASDAAAQ